MTTHRGEPTVTTAVKSLRVERLTVGQVLAFADELREQGAPLTQEIGYERSDYALKQLSCRWTEPAPAPPTIAVEGGALAEPGEFARLRKAAGLTQETLAERTGLARSSIANLEAGRQDVPLSKLQAHAEAVGARLVLGVGAAS